MRKRPIENGPGDARERLPALFVDTTLGLVPALRSRVVDPLEDASEQIHRSERAGTARKCSHGKPCIDVEATVMPLVEAGKATPRAIDLISPGKPSPVGPARSKLPLRVGRQSSAEESTCCSCSVERQLDRRSVGPRWQHHHGGHLWSYGVRRACPGDAAELDASHAHLVAPQPKRRRNRRAKRARLVANHHVFGARRCSDRIGAETVAWRTWRAPRRTTVFERSVAAGYELVSADRIARHDDLTACGQRQSCQRQRSPTRVHRNANPSAWAHDVAHCSRVSRFSMPRIRLAGHTSAPASVKRAALRSAVSQSSPASRTTITSAATIACCARAGRVRLPRRDTPSSTVSSRRPTLVSETPRLLSRQASMIGSRPVH